MENQIPTNRINAREAAKILGLRNERSVRRLCALGKLKPAFKVAESWQIPMSTIENYLKQCSNEN